MIRDTAYDGILKRARADLHTRFVAWADLANRDRGVEFEEILGYHLEQAWTYLSELGPLDERGREIGEDGVPAPRLGRPARVRARRHSRRRIAARPRRGPPPARASRAARGCCPSTARRCS